MASIILMKEWTSGSDVVASLIFINIIEKKDLLLYIGTLMVNWLEILVLFASSKMKSTNLSPEGLNHCLHYNYWKSYHLGHFVYESSMFL